MVTIQNAASTNPISLAIDPSVVTEMLSSQGTMKIMITDSQNVILRMTQAPVNKSR
jgi:hypothetical protein